MTSDRVMIWKFSEAPFELQSLHRDSQAPEWVALIPKSMYGDDLDDAFRKCSDTRSIFRYQDADGDVVLMGISQVAELVEVLAAEQTFTADAESQDKRKSG